MKATSICGKGIAAITVLFLFAVPTMAQDEDGPQTWGDDAKYVDIVLLDFKPGKRERALEIIDEHFVPAGEKAGTPAPKLVIHFQSGSWDTAALWDLAGGMADLEWYQSPDNVKWREALVEQVGDEEKAAALLEEWAASIARRSSQIGHYHTGETD